MRRKTLFGKESQELSGLCGTTVQNLSDVEIGDIYFANSDGNWVILRDLNTNGIGNVSVKELADNLWSPVGMCVFASGGLYDFPIFASFWQTIMKSSLSGYNLASTPTSANWYNTSVLAWNQIGSDFNTTNNTTTCLPYISNGTMINERKTFTGLSAISLITNTASYPLLPTQSNSLIPSAMNDILLELDDIPYRYFHPSTSCTQIAPTTHYSSYNPYINNNKSQLVWNDWWVNSSALCGEYLCDTDVGNDCILGYSCGPIAPIGAFYKKYITDHPNMAATQKNTLVNAYAAMDNYWGRMNIFTYVPTLFELGGLLQTMGSYEEALTLLSDYYTVTPLSSLTSAMRNGVRFISCNNNQNKNASYKYNFAVSPINGRVSLCKVETNDSMYNNNRCVLFFIPSDWGPEFHV